MPTPTPVGFESLGLGEIYKMGTSAVPKGHRQKAKTPPPHQAPTEKPTKAPLQRRQRGHARYAAKKSRAVALWATSQASPLRGEPRSGFPTSGNSGVPPLPACTRLRVATSSSAVVPPSQPTRRALCARGRVGDTTASRCAHGGVFCQPQRRRTAIAGSQEVMHVLRRIAFRALWRWVSVSPRLRIVAGIPVQPLLVIHSYGKVT